MRSCLFLGLALVLFAATARAEAVLDRQPVVPVVADAPIPLEMVERAVDATACQPCKPESPWSFGGGFALGLGQGNTDFFNLRADVRVERKRTPWGGKFAATYVYGEQESETITNNWRVLGRVERQISAKGYAFGQVLYERDPLSQLVYRWTFTAGLGWTVIDTARDTLDLEVGGGATVEKREGRDETIDPSGWLGLDWEHDFGRERKLNVAYDFRPNFNEFDLSASTLDIRYGMPCFGCVNLELALRLDHVIDPGPGIEELDLLFTVGFKFDL